MGKDDFYIGWRKEIPKKSRKQLQKLLIPVFLMIPVLAFVLVYFTGSFNDHVFQLGEVKTFTGTYFSYPVPILVMDEGQSPLKNQNHALLVGYGKNGAKTFLDPLENQMGPLHGKRIKLQGTLIYGDGKVLLELTEKENSILEVYDASVATNQRRELGNDDVTGEILDPKCWFGVMKPGEGKVHKSCAIRCISGGIPPVIRVKNNDKNDYYILVGELHSLNQDVLPFVAEQVSVQGKVEEINGWKVLWTNTENINYIKP